MLRRNHRMRLDAAAGRRARIVLLASAAWLAAAPAAAGQQAGIEAPRLLNEAEIERQVRASYPPAQRDSGVDGYVVLKFRVGEEGGVDPASVSVREATRAAFAEPATALVPRMRFAPARLDGAPVAAWITHTVIFTPRPASPAPSGGARGEGTIDVSAVEVPPSIRNYQAVTRRMTERYPPELRSSGVSGAVIVRFRILEDGTVDPSSLDADLTTDPRFDEAAFSVVREMRFRPAEVTGRPVKVWVTVPIQFNAPDPEPAPAGTAPGASAPS